MVIFRQFPAAVNMRIHPVRDRAVVRHGGRRFLRDDFRNDATRASRGARKVRPARSRNRPQTNANASSAVGSSSAATACPSKALSCQLVVADSERAAPDGSLEASLRCAMGKERPLAIAQLRRSQGINPTRWLRRLASRAHCRGRCRRLADRRTRLSCRPTLPF
jgi:hypothetical protein